MMPEHLTVTYYIINNTIQTVTQSNLIQKSSIKPSMVEDALLISDQNWLLV
jgi:hypothetical protein